MKSPKSMTKSSKASVSSSTTSPTTSKLSSNKNATKPVATVEMKTKKKNILKEESSSITQQVKDATVRYNHMNIELSSLINALQKQHDATVLGNTCKLETMVLLEKFAKDTPLASIVGSVGNKNDKNDMSTTNEVDDRDDQTLVSAASRGFVKTVSFLERIETTLDDDDDDDDDTRVAPTTPTEQNNNLFLSNTNSSINSQSVMKYSPTSITEDGDIAASLTKDSNVNHKKKGSKDSLNKKSSKKDLKNDKKNNQTASSKNSPNKSNDVVKKQMGKHGKMEEVARSSSSPEHDVIPSTPSTLVLKTKSKVVLDGNNASYCNIKRNMYVDSMTNATQLLQTVIEYAIQWKHINETRIKAGMYEFQNMTTKLEHYTKKMEHLSKESDNKVERNQQKLLGVLESHTTYGEKLLKYIDETTTRGWKDLYPLVLKLMEVDINMISAQKVYETYIHQTIDKLTNDIGQNFELSSSGRLHLLQSEPLGDVYTGEPKKGLIKPNYDVTSTTVKK